MLENCLPVISSAKKLILKVPKSDVIVNFPENAVISPYGQNNTAPVIVVFNKTDNGGTWQGADSDGIIIINGVSAERDVEKLLGLYDGTIEGLNTVISTAVSFGYVDIFTTNKAYARTHFEPASKMLNTFTGAVRRDDANVTYIYKDTAGTIRIVSDSERHIETDILQRDYMMLDGSPIALSDIPVV